MEKLKKIFMALTGVKAGVIYLIILAILTVLGSTYIKQGATYIEYVKSFGDFWAKIIWLTWLNNVFHSWYYQLLIFMLAVAVIVATIDRFPKIYMQAYGRIHKKLTEKDLKSKNKLEFEVNLPFKQAFEKTIQLLHSLGFKKVEKVEESDKEIYLFVEKRRFSRWGMVITHVGIIVFLVGAFMGAVFGIRGQIEIPEGESKNFFFKFREGSLQAGNEIHMLPFEIKVNKFWLDFYDSEKFKGAIKSFNSKIEIWQQGQLKQKSIVQVNNPTDYGGYRIFQATYGKTGDIKRAKLIVVDYRKMLQLMKEIDEIQQKVTTAKTEEEKKKYEKILKDYEAKSVVLFSSAPRIEYKFGDKFIKFNDQNLTVINQTLNYKNPMLINQDIYDPVIVVRVKYNNQEFNLPILANLNVVIPAFNQFGWKYRYPYLIMIEEFEPRYFSGLQITKMPGVNLIWIGTVIVVFGIMVAFYTVHRRIWVKVEKINKNKSKVYIVVFAQKFLESTKERIKEKAEEVFNITY